MAASTVTGVDHLTRRGLAASSVPFTATACASLIALRLHPSGRSLRVAISFKFPDLFLPLTQSLFHRLRLPLLIPAQDGRQMRGMSIQVQESEPVVCRFNVAIAETLRAGGLVFECEFRKRLR